MHFFIVQDYKENRRKCTLTPLEGRRDCTFARLRHPSKCRRGAAEEQVELRGGILLDVSGPPLQPLDRELLEHGPVILLDATWARLPAVVRRLRHRDGERLERRSLPAGFVTAYPRISKLFEDPQAGLASIEALYCASVILGAPCPDLLDGYRWRSEFLESNEELLSRFSVPT